MAHDSEELDLMASVISSFNASAAAILDPLGILQIREMFDLQVFRCWRMSNSGCASLSALLSLDGSFAELLPFVHDMQVNLGIVLA